MIRKFKSPEEEQEALERDPDFIALLQELKGQSPDRIAKLEDLLGDLERKDKEHGLES
jgi:hypothetical protein